jgi:hypothetical protein
MAEPRMNLDHPQVKQLRRDLGHAVLNGGTVTIDGHEFAPGDYLDWIHGQETPATAAIDAAMNVPIVDVPAAPPDWLSETTR